MVTLVEVAISVDTRRTLRHYAKGSITIICRYCDHRKEVAVTYLARRIGWNSEIERARRLRLTCSRCGNRSPALTITYDDKPRGYNGLRN